MADVFISYSRKDSEFVQRLNTAFVGANRVVWVDWQNIPRGEDWWREIQHGIESADAFICVVSEHWLTSEICHNELVHARQNNKRVLPVIRQRIQDETEKRVKGTWMDTAWEQTARDNWDTVRHLNWIFFDDDAKFNAEFPALLTALEEDQPHIKAHTRYQHDALEWERSNRNPSFLMSGDNLAFAETWLTQSGGKDPEPTGIQREYVTESRRVENELKQKAAQQERRTKRLQRATAAFGVLLVLAAVAIIVAIIQSGQVRAERELFGLQVERVMTLAAGGVMVSLDDIAPTPEAFVTTATAIAELAGWEPVIREFDGVEMVLVPPGCFWMGSTLQLNEQPANEVCFDELFWIDRYEVTNEQFERFGGEAGFESFYCDPNKDAVITSEERAACANLPRENINWYEARVFCEDKREARLPTEAEWEYAARGPDSLVYPWGNEIVGENTRYNASLGYEPAEVGEEHRPQGQSWVGTYDMNSNVWEWVNSQYFVYPYNSDDGREDLDGMNIPRVRRGGAFDTVLGFMLRTAYRGISFADAESYDLGFRCARSE